MCLEGSRFLLDSVEQALLEQCVCQTQRVLAPKAFGVGRRLPRTYPDVVTTCSVFV
jgi:hypothetical protein